MRKKKIGEMDGEKVGILLAGIINEHERNWIRWFYGIQ